MDNFNVASTPPLRGGEYASLRFTHTVKSICENFVKTSVGLIATTLPWAVHREAVDDHVLSDDLEPSTSSAVIN